MSTRSHSATLLTPEEAAQCLSAGGVIAYPTEGVFGLGCDPFNPQAVQRLLQLKQRARDNGLILIGSGLNQLLDLIHNPLCAEALEAFSRWPAAVTIVFPASAKVPALVRGRHAGVALRVTAHPLANRLCQLFGKPVVSTSANRSGIPPALNVSTVAREFGDKIDGILPGELLQPGQPSLIRQLDGHTLRK
jgi:L-threonylcarbamoyladenylate synthase